VTLLVYMISSLDVLLCLRGHCMKINIVALDDFYSLRRFYSLALTFLTLKLCFPHPFEMTLLA
jgi:hypothetical protein